MRIKEDLEHITPLTQYRASFLVALGHSCRLYRRGDIYTDDIFIVDGNKLRRKMFYDYARQRHKHLRHNNDMFYNIENHLFPCV